MSEWETGTSAGTTPGPIWVSAADAADKAGTSPGRVREWAREGVIASQPSNGPLGEQVMVRLDEVVERARRDTGVRPDHTQQAPPQQQPAYAPAADLSPLMKTIPELVAQLTAATDRAARAETKVEFLSRQVNDLRRRLADVPEEGEMALEQVNVAEEQDVEPTAGADPGFFDDDVDDALERGPEGEESGRGSSLEGIWDDDAGTSLDSGHAPPRDSGHTRDISSPPRRRWWRRRARD